MAIEDFGQNTRTGRLTDAPRAGKKEGMCNVVGGQCIFQCAGHMLLPDDIFEAGRPVFPSGYDELAHIGAKLGEKLDRGGIKQSKEGEKIK